MRRAFTRRGFIAILSCAAFCEAAGTTPTFEIADVHVSPRTLTPRMRGGVLRAGRYEIRSATLVDLIRIAYNVDADKVLGGPSWLETDRFDVTAKAPADATLVTAKLMLQAMLADRFKLIVHRDSHPLPGFALTMGREGSSKLKPADGAGEASCKATTQIPPPAQGTRINEPTILLPTHLLTCHGMTMAAFADGMRAMVGAQHYLGASAVVDQTGLRGAWDFNFKFTSRVAGTFATLANPAAETISLFDAIEKQLGLKLEAVKLPTPVIVVDSVSRKPTDNPPGVTTRLPQIPAEFEVADLRLSAGAAPVRSPGFQSGGRVDFRVYPLTTLINLALNIENPDTLVGAPTWLSSVHVDLIARMPFKGQISEGPANEGGDVEFFRPALLALLKERFKLAVHTEERPVTAYTLVAVKPKLRRSADPQGDPLMRAGCKDDLAPVGKAVTNQVTCQNMTMAQFAEELPRHSGGEIRSEVLDATGLEGAYDFTLGFSGTILAGAIANAKADTGTEAGAASDPVGGFSLFEAVQKQLGLKLERTKRPMPVIVIDRIEEKPEGN